MHQERGDDIQAKLDDMQPAVDDIQCSALIMAVGRGLAPAVNKYQIKISAEPSLPLTGNICDRRLWRIKGAYVARRWGGSTNQI